MSFERNRNTRRAAAAKHTRGMGYGMGFISTKAKSDSRRADHSGVRRHLVEQVLINEALITGKEGK